MCNIKIHFFIMWLRPYFVYMYPYADPTADEADPTADDGTAPIRFDPIRSDPTKPCPPPTLCCRSHRADATLPTSSLRYFRAMQIRPPMSHGAVPSRSDADDGTAPI